MLVRTSDCCPVCGSSWPDGEPGTRDCPADWRAVRENGSGKGKRFSRVPVIVVRQRTHRGIPPLGARAAGGRAGLLRTRSPVTLPALDAQCTIPKGYTARSHHPRAVEHRDCPPCGGDVGVIAWGVCVGGSCVRLSYSRFLDCRWKRRGSTAVIPQSSCWIPRNPDGPPVVIPEAHSSFRDPVIHRRALTMGPGSPLRFGRDDRWWVGLAVHR